MRRLIIIGGLSGAGKETTARLLFARLDSCAWIDAKWLIRVQPWVYGDELHRLGVRNAASLANNYWAAGFQQVILSGGVAAQERLDLLEGLLAGESRVDYIWLDVPKAVRDRRRIARARDDADRPEYVDGVDRVFTDPGPLTPRRGRYQRLDAGDQTPDQVAERVLDLLGRDSLLLSGDSSPHARAECGRKSTTKCS